MKTLEKKEFIKFLKIISINLDKIKIKHDIPLCHIDKNEWNYINIIITDNMNINDLINVLNLIIIKEKNNIIYTTIDNFDVRFIKSDDKMWQYKFYYYSWDVLHILLNLTANNLSISYEDTGLYYKYKNNKILLTTNLKDIFEFFDLEFHMIINGFATDYVIYSFIESSSYFISDKYTLKNIEHLDYYFKNNLDYYNDFIVHKPDDISKTLPTIEEEIALLDAFFPESKFYYKLSQIQLKEL